MTESCLIRLNNPHDLSRFQYKIMHIDDFLFYYQAIYL